MKRLRKTYRHTARCLTALLAAFSLVFVGCERLDPVSSVNLPADLRSTGAQTVTSSNGPIRILQVDPTRLMNRTPVTNVVTITPLDSSLFYQERLVEFDHDEEFKFDDNLTGQSKVKIYKRSLPRDMNVFFEWGGFGTYSGEINSREMNLSSIVLIKPAQIQLAFPLANMMDVQESTIAMYLYNDLTGQWERLAGELDLGNREIKGYLPRLGKIGLFHLKNGVPVPLKRVNALMYYAKEFVKADQDLKLEVEGAGLEKSKIEIDKHSLPADMTVAFEWAAGDRFEGMVNSVEYGANVNLSSPASLLLCYNNARMIEVNPDSIFAYLYDEATDDWIRLPSVVNAKNREVEATLPRFGKIALGYEEGGFRYDLVKLGEDVFYGEKEIKKGKKGTIELGDKEFGKTRIKFKNGDLPYDAKIKFEWAASNSLDGVLNDMVFGPHGINFNSPVEVELSYKMADLTGIDETSLKAYYYNEDTGIWELIGGEVDIKKKKIKFYLNHFSRYALSAD